MKQETKISSGTVKEFCVQVLRFVLALYHLWEEERKEMGKGRGMGGQHTLALLLRDHAAPLSVMCLMSLVLGSPLAANMLWNLREYQSFPLGALHCEQL